MTQTAHAHCSCDHTHARVSSFSLTRRWIVSLMIIACACIALRPLLIGQMLVRITAYATGFHPRDVLRLAHRVIFLDKNNIQAWTSLGYAYMDLSQTHKAIDTFEHAVTLEAKNKDAAFFQLGQLYYAQGNFPKAIFYFKQLRGMDKNFSVHLDADILKYRHGLVGFRSLNSALVLTRNLAIAYRKTGNWAQARVLDKEYELYKHRHSKILF